MQKKDNMIKILLVRSKIELIEGRKSSIIWDTLYTMGFVQEAS